MVIDARNFEDVKPFVRSRLLSSSWQKIDDLVKRNVAADMFLTFCMAFPDNSVYSRRNPQDICGYSRTPDETQGRTAEPQP